MFPITEKFSQAYLCRVSICNVCGDFTFEKAKQTVQKLANGWSVTRFLHSLCRVLRMLAVFEMSCSNAGTVRVSRNLQISTIVVAVTEKSTL